jgi:curli biogenesis system outer membrane secretion channel CsgG
MKQMTVVKSGMLALALIFVLGGCGGAPAPVSAQVSQPAPVVPAASQQPYELDAAIRETSDYLNKQLPKGNKLVILNVQSEFPALSEYIIDELIANTVNDRIFTVVDRRQLDTIRAELNFQYSGEVDDDTAQALGRMAGAQIIISGAVSNIGDLYRLRVRALSVENAQITGQFNRNIPEAPTVLALVRSRATGYGGVGAAPGATSVAATAPATVATPAPAQSAAAPVPAVPAPVAEAPAKTYKIGEKGPGGGIVFYDKFSNAGGWRYLEAAPQETEQKNSWGNVSVNGTSPAIGDGKRNTHLIVEALRNKKIGGAAQYCDDLEYGGLTDWFLPSRDELNLMYQNLKEKSLGGFTGDYYWTSNLYGSGSPYFQRFNNGEQSYTSDDARPYRVRPIRQF